MYRRTLHAMALAGFALTIAWVGGGATPVNSWQTPVLQHEATYYWRLRPRVQGDGTPVAWSQTTASGPIS